MGILDELAVLHFFEKLHVARHYSLGRTDDRFLSSVMPRDDTDIDRPHEASRPSHYNGLHTQTPPSMGSGGDRCLRDVALSRFTHIFHGRSSLT